MPSALQKDVEALEKTVAAQWANFGQGPGGSYNDDGALAWTEAPVSQLPYNAIVRTYLTRALAVCASVSFPAALQGAQPC